MMKLLLAALLCLAAASSAAGQFTRCSLYRFRAPANCAGLFALRASLLKLSCPGCTVANQPWRGAALGYDATKDFNCLLTTFYPSPALFTKYQTAEKANAKYTAAKNAAVANANFMAAKRL